MAGVTIRLRFGVSDVHISKFGVAEESAMSERESATNAQP